MKTPDGALPLKNLLQCTILGTHPGLSPWFTLSPRRRLDCKPGLHFCCQLAPIHPLYLRKYTAMFTGIITGVGRIVAIHDLGRSLHHGKRLTIEAPAGYLDDVGLGDSIALNGACMTVTTFSPESRQFTIDISAESLDKTSGLDQQGTVNLEKALRANDRLGRAHRVRPCGWRGQISHFEQIGESWELRLLAPHDLAKYLAYKGSITVNGVSLTVNRVADLADGCEISINLIPHTVDNTALAASKRAAGSTSKSTPCPLRGAHAQRRPDPRRTSA
jgi:riboflavin synthase